jgi:hypothetical protein
MGIEVEEGAKSTFDIRFESEADAADALTKIPKLLGWLGGFLPPALGGVLTRLTFEQDGKMLHADIEIPPEEVAKILDALSPLLMGEVVAPVGEEVTP